MDAKEEAKMLAADERAKLALNRLKHEALRRVEPQKLGRLKDSINDVDPEATRTINTVLRLDSDELAEELEAYIARLPQKGKPAQLVGSPLEGINGRDWHIKRENFAKRMVAITERHGYAVVRGAPETGKTSALQLTAAYLEEHRHKAEVHYLSAHRIDLKGGEDFALGLEKLCGVTWQSLTGNIGHEAENLAYLIVDEAQRLYPGGGKAPAPELFNTMKSLKQTVTLRSRTGFQPKLRVIIAATYGSDPSGLNSDSEFDVADQDDDPDWMETEEEQDPPGRVTSPPPASSPERWPEEQVVDMFARPKQQLSLAFTNAEMRQLMLKVSKMPGMHNIGKQPEVQELLLNLTQSLPGAVTGLLDEVISKCHNQHNANADSALWYIMATDSKFRVITRMRQSVEDAVRWSESRQLLRKLLKTEGHQLPLGSLTDSEQDVANRLLKKGCMYLTSDNCLAFISKLHLLYFIHTLTGGQAQRPDFRYNPTTDLGSFCLDCLQQVSPSELRRTLSTNRDGSISEAKFQYLFNAAASHFCGLVNKLHQEVGNVFGSDGRLDFLVELPDNKWWGIELLINGDRAAGHKSRLFDPHGRYAQIPFTDKVLIDFRQLNSAERQRKIEPGFLYVYFEEGYERVLVRQLGEADQVMSLKTDG